MDELGVPVGHEVVRMREERGEAEDGAGIVGDTESRAGAHVGSRAFRRWPVRARSCCVGPGTRRGHVWLRRCALHRRTVIEKHYYRPPAPLATAAVVTPPCTSPL